MAAKKDNLVQLRNAHAHDNIELGGKVYAPSEVFEADKATADRLIADTNLLIELAEGGK